LPQELGGRWGAGSGRSTAQTAPAPDPDPHPALRRLLLPL